MAAELNREDLAPDPIDQFEAWFARANKVETPMPNAMVLATVDAEGAPAARVVLLKQVDAHGFCFFTNYDSPKGLELIGTPRAALVFHWKHDERQVRIEGAVEKTTEAESRGYFDMRPRQSQIGAWASDQSSVIPDRSVLDQRVAEFEAEFEGRDVELPPFWGGFRLCPAMIEFWQARSARLHDRFRYTPDGEGAWRIERLAP